MPRQAETVKAEEKLRSMLASWSEATDEEKAKILDIVLDAVYRDLNKRSYHHLAFKKDQG